MRGLWLISARNPQKDLFSDFQSAVLTKTYGLFPKLAINAASAALRVKMKLNSNKTGDSGNVLSKSKEPLRVYGKIPSAPPSKTTVTLLACTGIALELFALSKKT